MGKLIIGLVIGLIIGGVGGGMLGVGSGAGVGIATGASVGICGVIKAAQDENLLTDEQVDQVFTRGLANIVELTGEGEAQQIVGGADGCDEVLQKLRDAA